MSFSSWLRTGVRPASAARRHTRPSPRQPAGLRPRLEALDERWLPSGLPYPTAATVSQLIADINYADKTGGAFTVNLKSGTTFDAKAGDSRHPGFHCVALRIKTSAFHCLAEGWVNHGARSDNE
jgi:hypothetical protein